MWTGKCMFERISSQQLMEDPEIQLKNFKKTKEYLVAIDTDGCIADNMNGKQMLVFHPMYMEFYQLWGIESYFREVAEYYNLFSVHRGCNRFTAISLILKSLNSRGDVKKMAEKTWTKIPSAITVDHYLEFCKSEHCGFGTPSLERFLEKYPFDFDIHKLYGWSQQVNKALPYVNLKIQPFENVKQCLEIMSENADVIVVSQTPYDDLLSYWESHGIIDYVRIICGQEMGSKSHHIEMVKNAGSYHDEKVLVIGDAYGDLKAAKQNNACFYPVIPGKENQSWVKFPEAFNSFLSLNYHQVENNMIEEFSKTLPDLPPWESPDYNHQQSYRQHQAIRKALYEKYNPEGKLVVL